MLPEDSRYQILKKLEANPEISQRQLAIELGISLGKVNYCLRALVEKGMVKGRNFGRSENKGKYMYLLTPAGIENKTALTARFLKRKMAEYETLRREIEEIKKELSDQALKDLDLQPTERSS
jgi:EPS-associated MarR family transcriptional regulator